MDTNHHEEIDTIEKAIEAVLSLQEDVQPTQRQVRRASRARSHDADEVWRREVLLAGREGSRRRQRWLNDRLADCEQAVEPTREDWAPEMPRHADTPYELASRVGDIPERAGRPARPQGLPRHVRADLKRKHVPSQLVRAMEDQIRAFACAHDDEEEEEDFVIVPAEKRPIRLGAQDPHAARFGRWLVHLLAGLYGLASVSQPPDTVILARCADGVKLPTQPLWLQL